ncbi:spermidine synthase [Thalassotalea atypica]|uniref:spermidine synthase n=1 Tax=Thalassotalea atypica TaxID=2054316 RepID=UPI002572D965|nr:fused MFS/spermidine synthase [Thalassotalea atypica]
MLFFQGFLLLGYLYAHGLSQLQNIKHQLVIHGGLLLVSILFLPYSLAISVNTSVSATPLFDILIILLSTVGVPYFVLSATGPLVQRWQSLAARDKLPYKLYSISNIGSLLALLSYPFVIEPWLTLVNQGWAWTISYVILTSLFLALIWQLYQQSQHLGASIKHEQSSQFNESKWVPLLWLCLSAVGVMLLVSTTNAMTQNIPPVPFLWILPLCLYLLTFIICFHSPKWYVRWYWFAFFTLSAFAAILMFFIGSQFDIISQTLMYSFILFSACMICHGELVHLKPHSNKLTKFYLYMSLGGFLGSVFVSIIAERVFVQFTEFPLAIFATTLLFMLCIAVDKAKLRFPKVVVQSVLAVPLGLLIYLFMLLQGQFDQHDVASKRNFYGLLKVVDVKVSGQQERRLIDGTTSHGTQILNTEQHAIPQSYYREDTGVALALESLIPVGNSFEPLNVGLIGLGAGTLAAYGKPQEYYHFYELNPAVKTFAEQYFSYIEQSKAVVEISLGDGRALLQQEALEFGSQGYDVLVVDAFSGDAIPTHLLTQEAFELYWVHLKEQGVLALHISNTHLDLKALTRTLAKSIDKQAVYFKSEANDENTNDAEWVLITNNQQFLSTYKVKKLITPWPESSNKTLLWTDDYSNLFSVLK